jgi:hypothetical protein
MGNPFTKSLAKVIDKAAPEVLDGFMDIATGPKKAKKTSSASSARATDWHTRVPAPPRKRH